MTDIQLAFCHSAWVEEQKLTVEHLNPDIAEQRKRESRKMKRKF